MTVMTQRPLSPTRAGLRSSYLRPARLHPAEEARLKADALKGLGQAAASTLDPNPSLHPAIPGMVPGSRVLNVPLAMGPAQSFHTRSQSLPVNRVQARPRNAQGTASGHPGSIKHGHSLYASGDAHSAPDLNEIDHHTWHTAGNSSRKIQEEGDMKPKSQFLSRRGWKRAIFMLWQTVTVVLAAYVFESNRRSALQPRQMQLEDLCVGRASLIQEQFKYSTAHIHSIQSFVKTVNASSSKACGCVSEHSPRPRHVPWITQEMFYQYVETTAYALPLVKPVVYAVRLEHKDRATFEEYANFSIIDGKKNAIREVQEEYAVCHLHGPAGEYVLHQDILSHSAARDVFLQARQSDGITISRPYSLVRNNKRGVLITFAVRVDELPVDATVEEKIRATVGYTTGAVDFETSVADMFCSLHQGAGSDPRENVLISIDDVTEPEHPANLYTSQRQQQQDGAGGPLGRGGGSGSPLLAWLHGQLASDALSLPWHHVQLEFGDLQRKHAMKCRYEQPFFFPSSAVLLAAATVLISLLLLQALWGALKRFEQMKLNYQHMAELKREADAGNRAKSAFLATMSHEIRTPMNGMLGMINLLLRTNVDALQMDYLLTAQSSGRALVYLINDVLDFSKIESGELELVKILFNIRMLVDEVLGTFAQAVADKWGTVELAALVQDSIPTSLIGDPVRLRQVLMYLVGNALKFTEQGHVFLTVRMHELARDDDDAGGDGSDGGEGLGSPRSPTERVRDSLEIEMDAAGVLRPLLEGGQGLGADAHGHAHAGNGSRSGSQSALAAHSYYHHGSSSSSKPGSPAACRTWADGEFPTLSGKETADLSNSWDVVSKWVLDEGAAGEGGSPHGGGGGGGRTGVSSGAFMTADRKWVHIIFEVEDTGIGIPPEFQERVLLPFSQVDEGLQRKYGGAGIGLTISQKLVDLMGGQLSFVSKPRVGTTFRFDMKPEVLERAAGRGDPAGLRVDSPYSGSLQGVRALVIDGKLVRQQVTATYLRRLGAAVDVCDNMYAAVMAIQQAVCAPPPSYTMPGASSPMASGVDTWDAVLVDADAGGPNSGLEFGQLLMRAVELKQPAAPLGAGALPKLILVASTLSEDQRAEAQRGGFSTMLLKPVRSSALSSCIQQALGLTAQQRPVSVVMTAGEKRLQLLAEVLKDKKILVVDDNAVGRKVAQATLVRYGVGSVVSVDSGMGALEELRPNHSFDCVLMDVQMPEMDGYETTRRIRAMEEAPGSPSPGGSRGGKAPRVPILALTADVVKGSWEACQKAGMDGFIAKPIEEEQLVKALFNTFVSSSKAPQPPSPSWAGEPWHHGGSGGGGGGPPAGVAARPRRSTDSPSLTMWLE